MTIKCRRHLPLPLFLSLAAIAASAAQNPDIPRISAVEPNAATTSPGSRVKVYGTSFTPNTTIYFDGLEVRETKFLAPSILEVLTPYLRPGSYTLQLKSDETTVTSDVHFKATPSPVDSDIDRALALAAQGHAVDAIAILATIIKGNSDYQVRAFAHYQTAQVYFALRDWWRWAGEAASIFDDADRAGAAVQTSWRYRLSYAESVYALPIDSNRDTALKLADWAVKYDVTQNPEPRFFRALINARDGNLQKAKIDSDFIVKLEPGNASYRALAAYIAVLAGDKIQLEPFPGEPIRDARALRLLGESAYLAGDAGQAHRWWTLAAREYPPGASLVFWAGKKHLARGQQRIAAALLTECTVTAADSKEAKEANDLLAKIQPPSF